MRIENGINGVAVSLTESNGTKAFAIVDNEEINQNRLNDYLEISSNENETIPSGTYNAQGQTVNDAIFYETSTIVDVSEKSYSYEQIKEQGLQRFPYNYSAIKGDSWRNPPRWNLTAPLHEQRTNCFYYDENKLNYIINYYIENGDVFHNYPEEFSDDEDRTKIAYRIMTILRAGDLVDEARACRTFENFFGENDAVVTIDRKGEIIIDTKSDVNEEEIKRELSGAGDDFFGFKHAVFYDSDLQKRIGISDIGEESRLGVLRWELSRKFGLLLEDLSIDKDGNIIGLTKEVYDHYGRNMLYFDDIRSMIKRGGDSDEILATITYKNGNLYVR